MAVSSRFRAEVASAAHSEPGSELARRGISRGALAGTKWQRTSRGFYRPVLSGSVSTTQRILDALPLLGASATLGGWAAAYVHGAGWLDGIDPVTGQALAIDILSPSLKRRSTSRVCYRKAILDPSDMATVHCISATSPMRTAFDGARWAENVEEAVVFLDAMIMQAGLVCSELAAYAREHHQLHGGAQVSAAVEFAAEHVASPWETRLRMCYRDEADLPAPLVNQPLFGLGGGFLGISDLFDPEAGLVVEYDGKHHRDRRQHHDDNLREELLESANLIVLRVDALDLRLDRRPLVRRLCQAYYRGIRRARAFDHWTLTKPGWWGRQ